MLQQIQSIPLFQLRTGPPFWTREPKTISFTPSFGATSLNEFYCQNGGSNLNGGSDNNNTAKFTSTNGNWSTTTNIFTPTDGTNPVAAGVVVGDFCSIYNDGATVGVFVGAITAVQNQANGTITVDTLRRSGTAPTTSVTARTIKVGGAWKGPQAAVLFPFSVLSFTPLTDAAGHFPRVNMKNDQTYVINSVLNVVGTNLIVQGYTTVVGDGGRTIIDGNGGGGNVITTTSNGIWCIDLIVRNTVGGTSNGFQLSGAGGGSGCIRCIATNIGAGGYNAGGNTFFIECEAYNCNRSNTASQGGFNCAGTQLFINCVSHDNIGSNNDGFSIASGASGFQFINCISHRNGRAGFGGGGANVFQVYFFLNCDAYNNVLDGIRVAPTQTTGSYFIRNCNFVKNGGYGINLGASVFHLSGLVDNCGFGSGSMANTLGQTSNLEQITVLNPITYPNGVTPWLDPDNGRFDLTSLSAAGAGRGVFTTMAAGYGPTVGYPDVGAAATAVSVTSEAIGVVGGG